MKNREDDYDLESAPEPLWDAEDSWDEAVAKRSEGSLSSSSRKPDQVPISPRSETAYLDGLRGLAALLVYLSHNVPWWYGIESPLQHGFGYHNEFMFGTLPIIRNLYTGGAAAVPIFFVMSGYVLSLTPLRLLQEGRIQETRQHLLVASFKRPIRLFGPVIALSLLFLVWMHLPYVAPQLEWPKAEPSFGKELLRWIKELGLLVNIFVKHGPEEHWFPYNPPAWTMAPELAGSWVVYMLLALTTTVTHKTRFRIFAALGAILFAIYQWEAACFLFGVALAIDRININDTSAPSNDRINTALVLVAGWILGQPVGSKVPELSYATPGWYYLTTLLTPQNYYKREYWRWWNVIGAVMLIDSASRLPWVKRILTTSWLQWLGKVSFMLYLVHIPIVWTVGDRVARVFGVQRQAFITVYDNKFQVPDLGPWGLSSGFLLWQAIVLPLSLWLANQATKRIDEPSLRLSRWAVMKIGIR